MTATVTLSQGSRSVTVPLLEESGNVLLAADLGKPELQLQKSGGTTFPRPQDNFSGLETLTFRGRLTSGSANSKARRLVDLLQSGQGDTPILFNTSVPEFDSDINVVLAAGNEGALTITHEAGRKDDVTVEASLTRVGRIRGTDTRQPTTPSAVGTGPIEIKATGVSVDISAGVTVTRSTGRPNDVVRRAPQSTFPTHISKRKTLSDTFTLSFDLVDNPVAKLTTITQGIFRQQLGRDPIRLDFNGIFRLGEIPVVPVGSAPFRRVRSAGYEDYVRVPTLELVRVFDR
jgi:hypothetical protein